MDFSPRNPFNDWGQLSESALREIAGQAAGSRAIAFEAHHFGAGPGQTMVPIRPSLEVHEQEEGSPIDVSVLYFLKSNGWSIIPMGQGARLFLLPADCTFVDGGEGDGGTDWTCQDGIVTDDAQIWQGPKQFLQGIAVGDNDPDDNLTNDGMIILFGSLPTIGRGRGLVEEGRIEITTQALSDFGSAFAQTMLLRVKGYGPNQQPRNTTLCLYPDPASGQGTCLLSTVDDDGLDMQEGAYAIGTNRQYQRIGKWYDDAGGLQISGGIVTAQPGTTGGTGATAYTLRQVVAALKGAAILAP